MSLVWCDDFDGPSIDPNKWEFEVNGQGGGNNELQYYTDRPENARIENGSLVIEARKETYTGPDGTRDYTSARLRTLNKGDWTHGRFEMRGKLPRGQGMWPAFWMLPTDWVYGGWAASGEIDIVELIGQDPETVYGTLHFGGPWPNNTSSAGVTAWGEHSYVLSGSTFNDDFHVFAIEWETNEIRWYVDGVHYQTQTDWYSTAASYPAPFDQAFHFIANVAVGGNWPGSPNGSTQFPQQFLIDWVRVFQ
jgi:beta-glucanase (GH16 family)